MIISGFKIANILHLVRGSVLAQLIFVLVTPVLTRIYTPEQLGVFGVFVAVAITAGKITSLRYDLAIPLPSKDAVAFHLLCIPVVAASAISISILLVYQIISEAPNTSTNYGYLQLYSPIVAIGIISVVLNEALIYWHTRKRHFKAIAAGKIISSASLAAIQISGFLFANKFLVILIAYPISFFFSSAYMLWKIDNLKQLLKQLKYSIAKKAIYKYREFPYFSAWATGMTEFAQSLPLLIITFFFGNSEAGFFFLARRIGLVPTSVVGRAITLVNHSDMLDFKKDNVLKEKLMLQIHQLQKISFLPAILLALVAPSVAALILGESWREVGNMLRLITPFVYVKFIFSPMGAINYIQGWQRIALSFEITSTAISSVALLWYSMHGDIEMAIGCYFAILALLNLIYRSYLMKRIGIEYTTLLLPTAKQLLFAIPILVIFVVVSG